MVASRLITEKYSIKADIKERTELVP